MGALHEGHRRRGLAGFIARRRRATRLLSIEGLLRVHETAAHRFAVGTSSDLDQYPRALERDLETLEAGVDACFAPRTPDGATMTRSLFSNQSRRVSSIRLPMPMTRFPALADRRHARRVVGSGPHGSACHQTSFAGVCTVVAKLWNLARPDQELHWRGQKDGGSASPASRLDADPCFPGEMIERWTRSAPTTRLYGAATSLRWNAAYLS